MYFGWNAILEFIVVGFFLFGMEIASRDLQNNLFLIFYPNNLKHLVYFNK